MKDENTMIRVHGLAKGFTLHAQGGIRLGVLEDVDLSADAGECVVLDAPSGRGKSTLLRALYGTYRVDRGEVLMRHRGAFVDLHSASPRLLMEMRRETIGYVSQFLRVIPRVPTLDIVAEPLLERGASIGEAREKASVLLKALDIPEKLWQLAPATFSGGEQQRVNIARALVADHPILLLDEPTASLDAANRSRVLDLIEARRAKGTAMVGIFHDGASRQAVATRIYPLPERSQAA